MPWCTKTRLGPHDLGEMREEGDDVVLDLALDRIDTRHVEGGGGALLPDHLRGLARDHAELGQRHGGMGLDLEPDPELRLRRPEGGHFRAGGNARSSLISINGKRMIGR